MYKVSRAGVSAAFVIAVSCSADFVLTAALWVVIELGTAVPASAFLVIYQSVSCNIPAACALTVLINVVFKPSVFTSPTDLSDGKSPSSLSCCVHKVSAWALAVALPYEAVIFPPAKANDWLVLIYHSSSFLLELSNSTS